MRCASRPVLVLCAGLCGFAAAGEAVAAVTLAARSVQWPGVQLEAVRLELADDDAGGVRARLAVGAAEVPALGWHRLGLQLEGRLTRDLKRRWLLAGPLKLTGAPGAALADARLSAVVDAQANTLELDLAQGATMLHAALPLDQPSHAQFALASLPVAWLGGVFGARPGLQGQLDAQLALDAGAGTVRTAGTFDLHGLGLAWRDGHAQGIDGSGRLELEAGDGTTRLELEAGLHDGRVAQGAWGAELPPHPVQIAATARFAAGQATLALLRVSDPDALQLEGALRWDAQGRLDEMRIDRLQARLPAAYRRYGRRWLAATYGLDDLRTAGTFEAALDWRGGGLHALAVRGQGLALADADGRLDVAGLGGALDWHRRDERPATTLAWTALRWRDFAFGPVETRWRSHAGLLALEAPAVVPFLGGDIHVQALAWRPQPEAGQSRLTATLAFTGIDLGAFSAALGWPRFPGTLGGAIPALRWVGDRIDLAGGLSLHVFDGFVDVTRLALSAPFGPHPELAADLALRGLDLAAFTSVFDIGHISGRLDGDIQGLRLVDWTPVAFDAYLHADGGGQISQRALDNLTALGGGSPAGGLQGAMLRWFKHFGYRRIGLRCRLADGVCRMGGLESDGDGYTILEGRGLPHLRVIGHQERVDWPTLVRRLQAAAAGGAPQVR